jgi:hypothetical protein
MAFLCVSQQGEFKNNIKNFLGKIHVKNFWPEKLRKKKTFFLSSFPIGFFFSSLAPLDTGYAQLQLLCIREGRRGARGAGRWALGGKKFPRRALRP